MKAIEELCLKRKVAVSSLFYYQKKVLAKEEQPEKSSGSSSIIHKHQIALVYQMRCLTAASTRFLEKLGIIEQIHLDQIRSLIKNYLKIP